MVLIIQIHVKSNVNMHFGGNALGGVGGRAEAGE